MKECEEAAAYLGLSDQKAKDDTSGPWENQKPPFCYLNEVNNEAKQLLFNKDGTNTGQCHYNTPCLCKGTKDKKRKSEEKCFFSHSKGYKQK